MNLINLIGVGLTGLFAINSNASITNDVAYRCSVDSVPFDYSDCTTDTRLKFYTFKGNEHLEYHSTSQSYVYLLGTDVDYYYYLNALSYMYAYSDFDLILATYYTEVGDSFVSWSFPIFNTSFFGYRLATTLSNYQFSMVYGDSFDSTEQVITRTKSISGSVFIDKGSSTKCYAPFIITNTMDGSLDYLSGTFSLDYYILYGNNGDYQSGFDNGYNLGWSDGESTGYSTGYDSGYDVGYSAGTSADSSFITLFGAIADTPVLMVRSLFDFDFFGVNLLGVVLSLFTALILFFIARKLL